MKKNVLWAAAGLLGAAALALGGLAAVKSLGVLPGDEPPASEQAEALTAPAARGTVARTVSGPGEVKGISSAKLKPEAWRWFKQLDAPAGTAVPAGATLVTYTDGQVLKAPYDLVVSSASLPQKNTAFTEENYLEVVRTDTMRIEMEVPEADFADIAEGARVRVKAAAYEGSPYEGTVSSVNRIGAYNSNGSKFKITVDVPNDGRLLPGMSASLDITVKEAADVLTVPVSAVLGSGSDAIVIVRDPDGSERHVSVAAGLSDGKLVEVAGELKEGDAVVLNEMPVPDDGPFPADGADASAENA